MKREKKKTTKKCLAFNLFKFNVLVCECLSSNEFSHKINDAIKGKKIYIHLYIIKLLLLLLLAI